MSYRRIRRRNANQQKVSGIKMRRLSQVECEEFYATVAAAKPTYVIRAMPSYLWWRK